MSAGVEGKIIADVVAEKPGVEVTKYPALIRIDANDKIEFDMDEIAEGLREEFSTSDFEIETSTHYGRMVRLDDKVLLFANPEDAAEAIGFELPEQEPQLPADPHRRLKERAASQAGPSSSRVRPPYGPRPTGRGRAPLRRCGVSGGVPRRATRGSAARRPRRRR